MAEWTAERTNLLIKLWEDGLSASQVARRLGGFEARDGGRSAVIGKVHRLGLSKRTTLSRIARKPVDNGRIRFFTSPKVLPKPARIKALPKPQPIKSEPVKYEAPAGGVTFEDLKPGQCKFALGAMYDRPEKFCGAPVKKTDSRTYPYCPCHCERAYYVRLRTRAPFKPCNPVGKEAA